MIGSEVGFSICRDNLDRGRQTLTEQYEIRRSHLADMARLCAESLRQTHRELGSLSMALADLSDKMTASERDASHGTAFTDRVHRQLARFDRIWFVWALAERLDALAGIDLRDLFPSVPLGGRVSYVRHRSTDRALSVLSSDLTDTTVSYTADMVEACEETVGGQSDLCLLPYRDGAGNPLHSGEELTARFGLFLNWLVVTSEGEFGVYARGAFGPLPQREPLCLAFLAEDGEQLAQLQEMANEGGGSLYEMRTSEKEEKRQHALTLLVPNLDIAKRVLLYRSLFTPTVRLVGAYQILTEGDT